MLGRRLRVSVALTCGGEKGGGGGGGWCGDGGWCGGVFGWEQLRGTEEEEDTTG